MKAVGKGLAHAVVQTHAQNRVRSRLKTGFRLFGCRQIPVITKVLAFALGGFLTLMLIGLELPLEGILGFVLPVFGITADVLFDGVELVALPIVFGSLFLTWLAPRPIYDFYRAQPA